MLNVPNRKLLIIAAFVIVVLILLVIPLRFEYKLKVRGKILPVKEWTIYKGTDGRLTSILTDYKSGINQSFNVTLFDRGDAMHFTFSPGFRSGSSVNVNDTVAFIYSNEIDRQIQSLKGQIASAKASLAATASGEKESIINQEKNNLVYAIRQAEEQKKIFDRIDTLYKKGLASQEEYEIAKGTYDLNKISISISESRLRTAQTGSKEEQINFFKTQISSLEKELSVLQKRFEEFTLISPVFGIVNRKTNSDTLMIISDTTGYVIISPVRIKDVKFITPPHKVDIYVERELQDINANLIEIDKNVHLLSGTQIVSALTILENKNANILPGLLVDCYVHSGSMTPLQYLERVWQNLVN